MSDVTIGRQQSGLSNPKFDDPSLVIAAAVTAGDRLSTSAEQLVFAWLLSLPPERDPAIAAANLLEHYEKSERSAVQAQAKSSTQHLFDTLAEVAAFPRERLTRLRPQRRRRQ